MRTTLVYTVVCVMLHIFIITQGGRSALMRAAWAGHTKIVVELVKAGANKDLQDKVSLDNLTLGAHV